MAKTLLYVEAVTLIAWLTFYFALSARHRAEMGFRPALLAASVLALCFLTPNLLLLHLSVALLFLVALKRPDEVGLALLASILLTPTLASKLSAGGVWLLDYSLHHTMALSAAAALLVRGGAGGKAANRPWGAHIPFLLFLALITFIEGRGATTSGWARQGLASVLTYALPYWVVTRSVSLKLDGGKALLWIAGTGVILAALAAFEMMFAWPVYLVLDQHFGIPLHGAVVKFRFGLMRSEGPMAEQTALGFVLVIGFVAALASRRAFKSQLAYSVVMAILALGLFAPQSRGAWIGAAVGMISVGLYMRSRNSLFRPVLAALGSLFVVLLALSYGGQSMETAGSRVYRDRLWIRGLEEFWHSPVTGSRWKEVVERLADLRQGEGIVDLVNSYLYVGLTAGSIGLAVFMLALLLPVHSVWRAKTAIRSDGLRPVAAFCFAALLSAIVMIAFTSLIPRPMLLVFICAGLGGIAAAQARGARRQRPQGPVLQGLAEKPLSQG